MTGVKIAKPLEIENTTSLLGGKQRLDDYTGYCGDEISPNLGVKAGFLRGLHISNRVMF